MALRSFWKSGSGSLALCIGLLGISYLLDPISLPQYVAVTIGFGVPLLIVVFAQAPGCQLAVKFATAEWLKFSVCVKISVFSICLLGIAGASCGVVLALFELPRVPPIILPLGIFILSALAFWLIIGTKLLRGPGFQCPPSISLGRTFIVAVCLSAQQLLLLYVAFVLIRPF